MASRTHLSQPRGRIPRLVGNSIALVEHAPIAGLIGLALHRLARGRLRMKRGAHLARPRRQSVESVLSAMDVEQRSCSLKSLNNSHAATFGS